MKLRARLLRARFSWWTRKKVLDWLNIEDLLWDIDHALFRLECDMLEELEAFRREFDEQRVEVVLEQSAPGNPNELDYDLRKVR
jgi:hypothetical protein